MMTYLASWENIWWYFDYHVIDNWGLLIFLFSW